MDIEELQREEGVEELAQMYREALILNFALMTEKLKLIHEIEDQNNRLEEYGIGTGYERASE